LQVIDEFGLTVEQGILKTDLRKHQQHSKRNAANRHHQPTPIVRQVLPS